MAGREVGVKAARGGRYGVLLEVCKDREDRTRSCDNGNLHVGAGREENLLGDPNKGHISSK